MNNQSLVPDQHIWEPWSPAELFRRLSNVSQPWCVVGGWALDLWHGNKTREHEDLEFTVLREDLGIFRRELNDMEFYTVNDGVLERLAADREPATEIFQIWCFDRAALRWRVDMMIEPGTDDSWVYKRNPQITRPRIEMVALNTDGIPYLNPRRAAVQGKASPAQGRGGFRTRRAEIAGVRASVAAGLSRTPPPRTRVGKGAIGIELRLLRNPLQHAAQSLLQRIRTAIVVEIVQDLLVEPAFGGEFTAEVDEVDVPAGMERYLG